MKNAAVPAATPVWPSVAELAALRGFHAGLESRAAVDKFLPEVLVKEQSARGVLGDIRRALLQHSNLRHRSDLCPTLERAGLDRSLTARQLQRAVDNLEASAVPAPIITDEVARWFSPRVTRVLKKRSIVTLADLTVRIPRLKGWWRSIAGLGMANAARIEEFFAGHPELTARAQALVQLEQHELIPWERLQVPSELNGSRGTFRAPRRSCVLSANDDYQALQTWLALQESGATQRAYRKEIERLILWAIIERGRALSSLTTEDAIAYRSFLRNPSPRKRWIGRPAPRTSPQWRPFQGPLSARSAAYALSVISALFRWLIEQRYVLANPFAGVRVKAARRDARPSARAFSEHEWSLIRPIADRLEDYGWTSEAAQRLRFTLDFARGTGLRSGEFVRARLNQINDDAHGERWIDVEGKGNKAGRVAIPPQARRSLERYLQARRLPTSPEHWKGGTQLLARIADDGQGLTGSRLWMVMKTFFNQAADRLEPVNALLAEKLRKASPHWMRHTHATHALARGASLTTVRDNLRHASVATTSGYLHTDEKVRAKELGAAFAGPVTRRGKGSRSRRRRTSRLGKER